MKRMRGVVLVGAVLGMILAGSPRARAQTQSAVHITLPTAGNIQHLAIPAAQYLGYFAEMGVPDTQIVILRGNAQNVQALVSGSTEFASAFGPAMQAMFRGTPLRILVQIFNQVPFSLITRTRIKSMAELKGARAGVTFGGSTYSVLLALFKHEGLPADFMKARNLPGGRAKMAALERGDIDAALMAPPSDRFLLKDGFKRFIYLGKVFKNVPFSALVTTARMTRERPDVVLRIVKAVAKSLLYLRENRQGAIDLIMRDGSLKDRSVAVSLYDLVHDAYNPILTADGVMHRAELEMALWKKRPSFHPEQFMAPQFLHKALQELQGGAH